MTVFPPSNRIRWLIDADCFFVSCERLRDPHLQWKIVCVGDPIIVTASYEAKALGVRVGTPLREAKKMLPKWSVFLSPDFARYRYVSQQLFLYSQQLTPHLDQASIDEVYLDMTDTKPTSLNWQEWAQICHKKLMQQTGIPITLGWGSTPLLAKLFASMHKPAWCVCALDNNEREKILRHSPLSEVSGIGRKTQPKFAHLETAFDFMQYPLSTIKARLGHVGEYLWHWLNWHALASQRKASAPPKSISSSRSFDKKTCTEHELRQHALWHRESVYLDLIKQNLQTKYIWLALRNEHLHRYAYEKVLPAYSQDKRLLQNILKELLHKHYQSQMIYKGVGIGVGDLIHTPLYRPSLFDSPISENQKKLSSHIESLNKKRGKKIIKPATLC